jgi:hypothetical protein
VCGWAFVSGGVKSGSFHQVGIGVCCVWGRLLGVINCIHEVCMVVSRGVLSVGSFLSYVVAARSRVALRVSSAVQREVLGPGLSPFGCLAMITIVGWMCRV